MANELAIHSVGSSLVTFLRNTYPAPLRARHPCTFSLLSSGELIDTADFQTTLSLFLYRVTMNEHLRNVGRPNLPSDVTAPLALDLHYLLTVWADNPLAEQTILAWAMRELHSHSVLDASSLSTEAGWNTSDVIQLIPAELSNEDIMRIWDALAPPYRLSVSYIARVVRIDQTEIETDRPVTASRFSVTDR